MARLKNLEPDIEKCYSWFEKQNIIQFERRQLKKYTQQKSSVKKSIDNLLDLGKGGKIKPEFFHPQMQKLDEEYEKIKLKIEHINKQLRTVR